MNHQTVRRAAVLFAFGGIGTALLTGCSSTSSKEPTTSAKPTQSASSSSDTATAPKKAATAITAAMGDCTKVSILAALPPGSTMVKYECAISSPKMWAAARVEPGPTVYFLQTTSGPWKVSKADQVCDKPKAALPREIGAFCPKV